MFDAFGRSLETINLRSVELSAVYLDQVKVVRDLLPPSFDFARAVFL